MALISSSLMNVAALPSMVSSPIPRTPNSLLSKLRNNCHWAVVYPSRPIATFPDSAFPASSAASFLAAATVPDTIDSFVFLLSSGRFTGLGSSYGNGLYIKLIVFLILNCKTQIPSFQPGPAIRRSSLRQRLRNAVWHLSSVSAQTGPLQEQQV